MRIKQAAQFTLINFFFASGALRANSQFNLTPGVTPISHDIYNVHMLSLWMCIVIAIGLFSVIIYSLIYHRKSLGVKATPAQQPLKLHLLWLAGSALVLIALAIPATQVLIHLRDDKQPDITIKVTGSQWQWQYEYFGTRVKFASRLLLGSPRDDRYLHTVDHPLVVPIHKKIRFLITSSDVIHSWAVPDLGVKHDAIPGFIYETWARINRPGTYYGQCSTLCGAKHGYMPIVVIAMTEEDFAQWLAQQKIANNEVAAAEENGDEE